MKPDGIEQEIWDAANEADRECQRDSCKNNACNGFLCANAIRSAILQARSQAYAECAKIVEARVELFTSYGSGLTGRNALKEAANSIRAQAIRQHSQKGEDK